jgi:hypothetical protein
MKNMSLHLIYGDLHTKFEQLWYHKGKLQVCLKITSQYVFKPTSH